MKLIDEIVIEATSDKVWQYVGSPEMWPLFHAKAVTNPIGIVTGDTT